MKYCKHWSDSERKPLIQSYYHEVNGEYEEAERIIQGIVDRDPSIINYTMLMSFYRRIGQVNRIGEKYEEILKHKPEIVNQDPDGFYFTYHEYLMLEQKSPELRSVNFCHGV